MTSSSPADIATLSVDYLGKKHLLGVAYLPEIGWYDLTLMDYRTLDLFDDLILGPVLFSLLLMLTLLVVGWALQRWVLKPIAILRVSTDKIRRGKAAH